MYKHFCTVSFNYNLLLFLEVCVDLLMILLNVNYNLLLFLEVCVDLLMILLNDLRLNRMSISTSKV